MQPWYSSNKQSTTSRSPILPLFPDPGNSAHIEADFSAALLLLPDSATTGDESHSCGKSFSVIIFLAFVLRSRESVGRVSRGMSAMVSTVFWCVRDGGRGVRKRMETRSKIRRKEETHMSFREERIQSV